MYKPLSSVPSTGKKRKVKRDSLNILLYLQPLFGWAEANMI
jgi:hypothetical protein